MACGAYLSKPCWRRRLSEGSGGGCGRPSLAVGSGGGACDANEALGSVLNEGTLVANLGCDTQRRAVSAGTGELPQPPV